jgi:transcriptional regulator with XRE-family HTH domain
MSAEKKGQRKKVRALEDEGRLPEAEVDQAQVTTPKLEPIPGSPGDEPEAAIGARIRFARNRLGLSIEALARYTVNFDRKKGRGISPTTILRYEDGDPLPGARELRILCEALNVPTRWLLRGELENPGEDAEAQRLLAALDDYVNRRANEVRVGGRRIREIFAVDDQQRRRWIAEARKPKGKG